MNKTMSDNPGGMLMPGRATGLGDYRYAYNGMETDAEVTGDYGNSYTTEFRQYDPRLMRWKSLDPLMSMFPWMSPYVAFNNNPIYFVDPLGLEGTNPDGGDGEEGGDFVKTPRSEPKAGGEGRIYNPDGGGNNGHAINNSHNTGWENVSRNKERTGNNNIIGALKRTNTGGYGEVIMNNGHIPRQGYICKTSSDFKLNQYYNDYSFKSNWKNILNKDNSLAYAEPYIYQDELTNTFVIREKYIYHKQIINRTRIIIDPETGEVSGMQSDEIIIEQKQYFSLLYNDKDHVTLNPNRLYQKTTVKLGKPQKLNSIEITREMQRLINEAHSGILKAEFYMDRMNHQNEVQEHADKVIYELEERRE